MEEDILKGYEKGLETNIPWKIPHYGEHQPLQTKKTNSISPSNNVKLEETSTMSSNNTNNSMSTPNTANTTNSSTASYQDIKFVNYILENNHYKFSDVSTALPGNNTNKGSHSKNSICSSTTTPNPNSKNPSFNTYLENDAILEFNNMLKENQSIQKQILPTPPQLQPQQPPTLLNNNNVSPTSRYKYIRPRSRTKSVPMLSHINKISKSENSIICNPTTTTGRNHNRHHSSTIYYNYNPNNIVKYDMGSLTPGMVAKHSTPLHSGAMTNRNNSKGNISNKSTPIRYNPRKYMDDNDTRILFDEEDIEFIPKDMEIDLEQLLACDTVDRILSPGTGNTTTTNTSHNSRHPSTIEHVSGNTSTNNNNNNNNNNNTNTSQYVNTSFTENDFPVTHTSNIGGDKISLK